MVMTKADAQDLTRRFLQDYPGAMDLAYKFRRNTAELYGPRAGDVPSDAKGGYLPKDTPANGRMYRGRVDVVLNNIVDARDLLITLRHEVLGHYGANTFLPAEKRALLDGVIAGREEPTLKPLWDSIDKRYVDSSLDSRAEEVIALQSEGIAPRHHIGNNLVHERGTQSFKETAIARVRPMAAADLHNILCMVAHGLHDRTRTQQTFPELNEQFRKGDTMKAKKKPFHEVVAERLIEQLKAGTAPWQRPWQPGEPNSLMPMNPTTGKRYKGINAIHLMSQGRADARWMTYRQAAAVGAQVLKGETGTPVQFWKFTDEHDKLDTHGKPVRDAQGNKVKETVQLERPRVFFATVFNAEQIEGLPPVEVKPTPEQQWNAIERAEHIMQASGARISHVAGDRAFYRPSTDSITLPEKSQFASADRYYAVALHELGHWTGHPSRLDRDLGHPFGSMEYAKEELRAEIASMILGDQLGIGHDPEQHVAYVGSWIKTLQDDPLEIFRASSDAEKIHDYVMAFEQKMVQEHEQQEAPIKLGDRVLFTAHDVGTPLSVGVVGGVVVDVADTSGGNIRYRIRTDTPSPHGGGNLETLVYSHEGRLGADLRHPHEMTMAEFTAQATAVKLENHGRQWDVNLGDRYAAFSDAESMEAAIADVHRGAVNNALYLNTPGAADIGIKPSFPPANVLAEYPDLVERFPDAAPAAALGQQPSDTDAERSSSQYEAMKAADVVFQRELVRVYGEDNAGDARYMQQHEDDAVQKAGEAFVAASDAWHKAIRETKQNDSSQEGTMQVLEAQTVSVLSALEAAGWTRGDGDAIASMSFDTVNGRNDATVFITNGDGINRTLQFQYTSEGRNVTSADGALIPVGATAAQASAIATAAVARAMTSIRESYGVVIAATQQVKQYINVPFAEKDEAKQLGARWDRQQQSWYVPNGVDVAPFAKWVQQDAPVATEASSETAAPIANSDGVKTSQERAYLAVPYADRGDAKAAGALWDKSAKSWYAGPNADMAKLERWKPENVSIEQGPAMSPREEFADAMKQAGLKVGSVKGAKGDHPIMDGMKHRVPVDGGKAGALDGFYVGHLDGHPAGRIINNKTGTDIVWKSKGYVLSDDEKAKLHAEAATKLAERSASIEKQQEETAKRVARQLGSFTAIEQPTPYLKAKGIAPHAGAMTDKDGQKTYIPAFDVDGKLWTMQYIQEDGTKRFAKDSRKEGTYHVVGGHGSGHVALEAAPVIAIFEGYATAASSTEALGFATVAAFDSGNLLAVTAPVIAIFEGYATAASSTEALGFATVAAFDSGNLAAVATALRERYPDKPIMIGGDDDQALAMTHGTNAGRTKAEAAAYAVGGLATFPIFAAGESNYPASLAPVTPEKFKAGVLTVTQLAAIDRMKQFTDFNDLATRSAFGPDGLSRQLLAAVDKAHVHHRQCRTEQQQAVTPAVAVDSKRRSARVG